MRRNAVTRTKWGESSRTLFPMPTSLAQRYHDATKYTPESIAQGPGLDYNRQPPPFKPWVQEQAFALTGRRGDEVKLDPGPLDAARLGRLLHHTYGITRIAQHGPNKHLLRAAPSAGALYPSELYVALRSFDTIPDGIYAYHPAHHALRPCWEGDFIPDLVRFAYDPMPPKDVGAVLIGTGFFDRSAWRYRDRAYRRVLLDTGHMMGNALLAAQQDGQGLTVVPDFMDDGVNQLLLLDPAREGALLLGFMHRGKSGTVHSDRRSASARPDDAPHEGAWIPIVHASGTLDPTSAPASPDPFPYEATLPDDVDEIKLDGRILHDGQRVLDAIRARRSTRIFQGGPIPQRGVGRMLVHAHPCSHGPFPRTTLADGLLKTFVAINDVTGIPEGTYAYHPVRHSLLPIVRGSVRRALHHGCLGQELARDCSFAVIHAFQMDLAIQRFGDRAYRTAHLEAGLLGQRLNLAAARLGFGASGIGGFFDDVLSGLLGMGDHMAVAYVTTIGVPAAR